MCIFVGAIFISTCCVSESYFFLKKSILKCSDNEFVVAGCRRPHLTKTCAFKYINFAYIQEVTAKNTTNNHMYPILSITSIHKYVRKINNIVCFCFSTNFFFLFTRIQLEQLGRYIAEPYIEGKHVCIHIYKFFSFKLSQSTTQIGWRAEHCTKRQRYIPSSATESTLVVLERSSRKHTNRSLSQFLKKEIK